MSDFLFWNEVVIPLAGMALAGLLGYPVVRGIVRYLERKGTGTRSDELGAVRAELAELRERVADLDHTVQRVAELEERLDFTERVLAHPDRRELAPGGEP